jgi:hypothetical protein
MGEVELAVGKPRTLCRMTLSRPRIVVSVGWLIPLREVARFVALVVEPLPLRPGFEALPDVTGTDWALSVTVDGATAGSVDEAAEESALD